ncbi:IS110 family transposase [Burkholderia sp. MS455]|nr:IS110 family transposase [Burkholderia sp. MS455]
MRGWTQCQVLVQEIAWLDRQISNTLAMIPSCLEVCGVGPLTTSAVVASMLMHGNSKNGLQIAAWVDTIPRRQNSSGGEPRLGRITKQGNDYMRTLLYQGALGHPYRPSTCRPARSMDRPSAGPHRLLPDTGGRRQQTCPHALPPRKRREIRSITRVYCSTRGDPAQAPAESGINSVSPTLGVTAGK